MSGNKMSGLDTLLDDVPGLLDLLFDRMPVGIAVFDRDLILRRASPTWAEYIARYTPTPPSEVVPGAAFLSLAPGAESTSLKRYQRALAGETVREDGVKMVSGGIVSYWDVVLTPLVQNGEVVGVLDVTSDATSRIAYQLLERRAAEQERRIAEGLRDILALLNSHAELREILDRVVEQAGLLLGTRTVALYRLEPDGTTLTVQASRGLAPDFATNVKVPTGLGAVDEVIAKRKPAAIPDVGRLISSESPAALDQGVRDYLLRLARRSRALLAVPLIVKGETYGGIALYYPDAREFTDDDVDLAVTFADQAALAIENARLREQSEESAAAAERTRLARDLHDAVTQTLFSASLIAEVLPRLWERDPREGARRVEELRLLTRGALAEMRALLMELRPSALVAAPIAELFGQLADATSGRGRLPVRLTVRGERVLPPEVKLAVYRIAQEALNNVARHSGASSASIELVLTESGLSLRVEDDGRGFDLSAITPEHLGLKIMRERADDVGAVLTVESQPGRGTRVQARWLDAQPGEVR